MDHLANPVRAEPVEALADPSTSSGRTDLGRLDERSLSKLRWRCRRGLLENDLFIDRFFRHHEETITTRQAAGLMTLMDLADNDLLDLLLGRKPLAGEVDTPQAREVLAQLRRAPVPPHAKHAL